MKVSRRDRMHVSKYLVRENTVIVKACKAITLSAEAYPIILL